jgi:MYXO-CTERM domain-containing protein
VTAYRTGQTITISFRETIFHPGHFRVALATTDRSELPAVPPVTPGATDCGTVPIMDPPVFPVLGDGLLPHTSPLSGVQTLEVTLPDGVTCDHCTLQVVQFMSSHGAPCFYYHCADISISDVVVDAGATSEDASVPAVDAATSTMADAASTAETDSGTTTRADAGPSSSGGGCACTVVSGRDARGALVVTALVLGALVRRRRRR